VLGLRLMDTFRAYIVELLEALRDAIGMTGLINHIERT